MLVAKAESEGKFYDWYCNVPLGENTPGTSMNSISKQLKLSEKHTNHCCIDRSADECHFEAAT